MLIPGWLKGGLLSVGGTILGVVATLFITSYKERPRPSAEIAQISITNFSEGNPAKESHKRIVSVPLDESLFSELSKSAWTEAFRDPSDDLLKVISKLNRNREYVENYLRHAESYFKLKKEMTLLLNGERSPKAAENFFDDWQQIDGFIYGSIRSQMRYGSSALERIACKQETSASHLHKLIYSKEPDAQYFARAISEIYAALSRLKLPDQSRVMQSGDSKQEPQIFVVAPQQNRDTPSIYSEQINSPIPDQGHESTSSTASTAGNEHIYSVTKEGGRYKSRFDVRSNLDENEIVTLREEKCAETVMAALADFDKEKLNAILDITEQEANNADLHKKIQSEIDQYIKGYSFWNISMLIVNKGKDPISFSPNATLYVDMSGATIHSGNNLIVNLKAISRNANGESDSILVPGGESRSINFISSELVKDYGDWKNLITAFEQSSRNCVVVLYPQTGDWLESNLVFSPVKSFGPPPSKAGHDEDQNISAHFAAQRDHKHF